MPKVVQINTLTDNELRASDVNVSLGGEIINVLGPLTNTELRAVPVDVLGPLTAAERALQDPSTETTLALVRTILGITTDPAVITDADGTIQQYLRGLIKLWITSIGQQNIAASQSIVPASNIPDATYIGDIKFGEPLPDTAAGDLAGIQAKGYRRIKKEFTRPANVTQYAANDCLADNAPGPATQNLPFAGRVVGGSGSIVRVDMATDNLSWTNPITLVIYDENVPAAWIADNDPFDPKYVDKGNIVATISLSSFSKDATGAAGSYYKTLLDGLNIPYKCKSDSQNLYYQCFIPSGTPTPASEQKFYLNVGVWRD